MFKRLLWCLPAVVPQTLTSGFQWGSAGIGSGIVGSKVGSHVGPNLASIGKSTFTATILPTIDHSSNHQHNIQQTTTPSPKVKTICQPKPYHRTGVLSANWDKQRSKHRIGDDSDTSVRTSVHKTVHKTPARRRAQTCCDRLSRNLSEMEYSGSEEHETECSEAIIGAFRATEIDDPKIKRNLFQTPQKGSGYRPIVRLTAASDQQYPAIVAAPNSLQSSLQSSASNYFDQGVLESDRLYFVRHPGGKMRAPDSLMFYHSKSDNRFRLLYFEYKSNVKRNNTITCGNTNPCPDHIYLVNKRVFWSGLVYLGSDDQMKFEKLRSIVRRNNEELRRFGLPGIRPGSRRFSPIVNETTNTVELHNRISCFLSALKTN